jgi:hypothetical protein
MPPLPTTYKQQYQTRLKGHPEVAAKTSRGARESASAANRLSILADNLRRIVSQFKIK